MKLKRHLTTKRTKYTKFGKEILLIFCLPFVNFVSFVVKCSVRTQRL